MISHTNWVLYNGNTFTQTPQTNLSQLDAVVAKIYSFEKLPDGWHFGRGTKISGWASVNTQRIAGIAIQNSYDVEIFPGSDRDILLALKKGDNYYEVIANEDSTVSYFLETRGVEVLRQDDKPIEEIEELLNKDNAFIWYTFASSIQFTGTLKNNDSSASLSETQRLNRERRASQLSNGNASPLAA